MLAIFCCVTGESVTVAFDVVNHIFDVVCGCGLHGIVWGVGACVRAASLCCGLCLWSPLDIFCSNYVPV